MRDRVALGYASSAINSPPPRSGEVRRTRVPDDFNGIRFEIGRMTEYVREGRKDPLIIDTARQAAANWGRFVEEMSARRGEPVSAHNNKTIQAEGCDIFCRHYFYYVNDPTNVEVIQTPKRMVKQTKVPREVLAHIMEPFYRAMEEEDPAFDRSSYEPPPMYIGDCDEPHALFLAMCAALDIVPVHYRFGGFDGMIHHVWGRVKCDGNWYDCDLTEPGFRFGDFSPFEHYEELEVKV